jgi:hypothetical protein
MRSYRVYLALLVVAIAAVGVVVVACGETAPACQEGQVALTVQLFGTAANADHIEVDCGSTYKCTLVMPDMLMTYSQGLAVLDVMFPDGYPTEKLVVITVKVRGGGAGTLLGQASANIHLLPGCSTGYLSVTGGALPDAAVAD